MRLEQARVGAAKGAELRSRSGLECSWVCRGFRLVRLNRTGNCVSIALRRILWLSWVRTVGKLGMRPEQARSVFKAQSMGGVRGQSSSLVSLPHALQGQEDGELYVAGAGAGSHHWGLGLAQDRCYFPRATEGSC